MAQIYEEELTNSDGEWIYVAIPRDWKGAEDKKVQVILNDLCLIVPEGVMNATKELLVLRFLEAMIDAKIIDAGDVQKAVEHIL